MHPTDKQPYLYLSFVCRRTPSTKTRRSTRRGESDSSSAKQLCRFPFAEKRPEQHQVSRPWRNGQRRFTLLRQNLWKTQRNWKRKRTCQNGTCYERTRTRRHGARSSSMRVRRPPRNTHSRKPVGRSPSETRAESPARRESPPPWNCPTKGHASKRLAASK